jgi:hypothetical protein
MLVARQIRIAGLHLCNSLTRAGILCSADSMFVTGMELRQIVWLCAAKKSVGIIWLSNDVFADLSTGTSRWPISFYREAGRQRGNRRPPVAPDKLEAPSASDEAGATHNQLHGSRSASGRAHHDRDPHFNFDRRNGDWRNRLVARHRTLATIRKPPRSVEAAPDVRPVRARRSAAISQAAGAIGEAVNQNSASSPQCPLYPQKQTSAESIAMST